MINADAEWLRGEIEELLDAGSVGLYEFVETMRERRPEGSVVELTETAQRALELLRASHRIELVELVWPGHTPSRRANWDEVRTESWDAIGEDGVYLAIRYAAGTEDDS